MSKKPFYKKGPTRKQIKKYAHILSEDEELVIITGYSTYYIRNRFAIFMLLPGGLFWGIGLAVAYYYNFNLGFGLLAGYAFSIILALLLTMLFSRSRRYLLTTRRVIIRKGILNVKLISALFDKITHIEVDQGFIDRVIMHHGTIMIHTAGMNKDEFNLEFIEAPLEFKNLMERLINSERESAWNKPDTIFTIEGELVKS